MPALRYTRATGPRLHEQTPLCVTGCKYQRMPAIPVGPALKLIAQYGPLLAEATKKISGLDADQRQRVLNVLGAADRKRRLRDRVLSLRSTLEGQSQEASDQLRRERSATWLRRVDELKDKLVLADGLPAKPRRASYRQVEAELMALVHDITQIEMSSDSPATTPVHVDLPVQHRLAGEE